VIVEDTKAGLVAIEATPFERCAQPRHPDALGEALAPADRTRIVTRMATLVIG